MSIWLEIAVATAAVVVQALLLLGLLAALGRVYEARARQERLLAPAPSASTRGLLPEFQGLELGSQQPFSLREFASAGPVLMLFVSPESPPQPLLDAVRGLCRRFDGAIRALIVVETGEEQAQSLAGRGENCAWVADPAGRLRRDCGAQLLSWALLSDEDGRVWASGLVRSEEELVCLLGGQREMTEAARITGTHPLPAPALAGPVGVGPMAAASNVG